VLVGAKALVAYLWKMLWPLDLVPFYPYPGHISILSFEYFPAIVLVIGITGVCIVLAKKQKLWLSVWGYYVITMLPVLGIVQVGGQSMADRYTYLPSLGPFLLIGLLAGRFWTTRTAYFCAAATIPAVLLLSFLTYRQITIWKNSLTLWNYVAEKPESFMAHYNLGIIYRHSNMPDKAIEEYLTAIRLWPGYSEAHNNLGFVYKSLNMTEKAEEEFLTAIRLKPDNVEAHSNLGILYEARNLSDKATVEFLTAVKLKPDNADAHFNLGLAYYKTGHMEEARHELERVLEIKPENQQAQQLMKEAMAKLRHTQ
jgi:tetratricopeptide (TPR) repeat protein